MPPGEEAGRHRGRGSAANAGQRRNRDWQLHRPEAQKGSSLSISLLCVSLGVLVDFSKIYLLLLGWVGDSDADDCKSLLFLIAL